MTVRAFEAADWGDLGTWRRASFYTPSLLKTFTEDYKRRYMYLKTS